MSLGPCLGTDTLVAFVDGHSSEDTRARVLEHASHCEACRQLLSSLARGTTSPAAPERVGRYMIDRKLGAGGMGVVYAAHDPELGRTVAVKLLYDHGVAGTSDRLRREAQVMAQLAHPNVVTVFDVGTFHDQVFVAMEYVDGATLARWLQEPRGVRAILEVCIAAGRGLAAAHAAGIVHRDFKPDNVLIGSDGRVRVADFGLARTSGTLEHAPPPGTPVSPIGPTAPAGGLTQTGAIVGTPFFMAPELYGGGVADVRSDQFAFSVTVFTALYGERPFAGDTLEELGANVRAGHLREPSRSNVSRRVRLALRRGLAVDPAERFATMDALLAELEPPRRRWLALEIGAVGVVLAGIAAFAVTHSAGPEPCNPDGFSLGHAWDGPRRVAVSAAMLASGARYAGATRDEVARVLDRYSGDWQTMQVDACRATHVRGEQTADMLDLRTTCLDERRRALASLTDLMTSRDPRVVVGAAAAANALPAIADCADLAALESPVRPPNPAVKSRVRELTDQLIELRAHAHVAPFAAKLTAAKELYATIKQLGFRPLEARALELVAALENNVDDYAAAGSYDAQAVLAAEAGRDDREAIVALTDELDVVGDSLQKFDLVPALRDRANALLERVDRPPPLVAELATVTGTIEMDQGQFDAARADLDAAIKTWERLDGPDDLKLVDPLRQRAQVELSYVTPDQADKARADVERALAIQRRTLGDAHPEVAQTIEMLGAVELQRHEYREAIRLDRDARDRLVRDRGATSMAVADIDRNLADALVATGSGPEMEEAIALDRRALGIVQEQVGTGHPKAIAMADSLADLLSQNGRHAEAIPLLEATLATARKQLGDSDQTATTLQELANAEYWLHHLDKARDYALAAIATGTKAVGPDYRAFDSLLTLGDAYLDLHQPGEALAPLARALATAGEIDPFERAWTEAQLARARYDTGGDANRREAARLLAEAVPVLSKDERGAVEWEIVKAWLVSRGLPTR